MEVMAAVKSGTLLHALRVQLKRRVSALRGGDYNKGFPLFPLLWATQKRGPQVGKKLKHEKLEETKHGLFRNCFLGAPECTRNWEKSPI